jgi:hypothetical protein
MRKPVTLPANRLLTHIVWWKTALSEIDRAYGTPYEAFFFLVTNSVQNSDFA